jgi:hypothetical protein
LHVVVVNDSGSGSTGLSFGPAAGVCVSALFPESSRSQLFRAGRRPRELFSLPAGSGADAYEAAPNGQRFLVGDLVGIPEPLNVIIDWPPLLKQVAGAQIGQ